MNVAILSESPADEAALRVLVEAVLGGPIRQVQHALRARGWPSVAQVLPGVIRHLHFNTDADGLVVVVDSDNSVLHTLEHDRPGHLHSECRLCRLRSIFQQTVRKFPPARGRARMLRGVGLCVPAIEAWYLCGRDERVTEAVWAAGLLSGVLPYTRDELKWRVYGTDRPGLPLEIQCALAEVRRQRGDLRRLENDFPNSFGPLARDLGDWKNKP